MAPTLAADRLRAAERVQAEGPSCQAMGCRRMLSPQHSVAPLADLALALILTLSRHDLWGQTSPVPVRAPLLAYESAAAQGARRRMRAWVLGLGLGQARPYKSRRSTSASAAISARVRVRRSASRSSRSPGLQRALYVMSEDAPAIGCHSKHVCSSVFIVTRICSFEIAICAHTVAWLFRVGSMCNGVSWP